jgi:NADPH:quinone reductase-like Zn-dependent oxidoreductase
VKAIQFAEFGTPHEVARCVEVAEPAAPGSGQVLIAIDAFPINPVDMLTIQGRYAVRPPLPAFLGSDGVGTVLEVGEDVDGLAPGDRVLHLGRENWMQRKTVPAAALVPLDPGIDLQQAAMLKINPASAALMLERYVTLEPGDWVIQDAANSGVGHYLIRLARARGLHTVNVVRREGLEEDLRGAGADVVVVDGPDLAERVHAATGGGAIRLAIDAVAGDICIRLGDCLAEGGTIVNYGLLSGEPCALRADQVTFKGITLTGFWLVKHLGNMPPAEVQGLFRDLAQKVLAGDLHVDVEAVYGIDDIARALAHAGRDGRGGKILVTPNA